MVGPQEGVGAGHRLGAIHHHPHQLGAIEVAQHPMDEVLVAVEQHGGIGRLRRLLNRLPLAQQGFQVVDQQVFTDGFRLGADQQAGARGLDQHPQGPQAIALVLRTDAAGDVHPLAVGLQHQEATGQGEVAGEAGPLGAGGLLHHLHQHLLARFQQFGDAAGPLSQAQGPQIGDMNEAIFFALANIYESRINAG